MNPNYSRDNSIRKRKEKTGAKAGHAAGFLAVKVFFVCFLAVVIVGGCAGAGILKGLVDSAPDISNLSVTPSETATYIYDQNGTAMQKLTLASSNRTLVTLDQIPEDLQHAVVAIEDQRFYQHKGIDIPGIARAFVVGITSGSFSEGASTITQQLLKNNVFTDWTNESTQLERFTRKFQEQYLAVQIEKKYDKNVILENYLNTINLGAGAYGVQAAARQYFNKDVWDLNLSECATLAGITQAPTKYNPIENPKENAKRRKEVLDHMLDQGYITQEQYDDAINDDVYTRIQEAQASNTQSSSKTYSYFEDELTKQVINDLMNIKGYTKTQAQNLLYSGGLKIMTTQDPDIQNIVDEEYSDPSNYPDYVQYALDYALTVKQPDGQEVNYSKEMMKLYFQNEDPSFDLLFDSQDEGQTYVDRYKANILADGSTVVAERVSFAPQPQSAMTIIDQHTGYVKAIIGGRGTKTASLTLNRATDSTRQPGSTFKIVSTYAAALNEKGMTLATTYEDQPITYDNGAPVNNASGSFNGTTTIRTAIRNSVNTVAVQCFEDVTPELGLKYLDNFGFTTLAHGTEADTDANGNVYTDANLPTALGGLTYGVKNVELCAAYAAIANGGNYIKPVYYTKILDHNGNVLIENNSVGRSVIKETTAYLLTSALEDVVQNGTGTACQLDNMTVAGKTGTTDAYNDLWFVGYTPYYTCAVWSGYDGNQKIPEGDARNFHKTLWRKVMNRIHQGMEYKDFEVPDGIEQISICADTGLLPRVGCPVTEEYFDVGTMPTEYCDQHFYEYDESQDEDMEISDENATPTPDPENPDGTDNADGSGGDGTGGDGTGGDGTGGDGTGGGDIQYPDESGGDSGNDDIYYY